MARGRWDDKGLGGGRQGLEQRFVETFIPALAVEAFDNPVLLRLPRGDIVPFDLHPVGPFHNPDTGLVTVLCRYVILLGGFSLESEWADAAEI